MSTESKADGLTERDRQVRDQLADEADLPKAAQEQIDTLRSQNRELEAEVQDLRDELTATKQTLFAELNKLRDQVNGQDPTDPRANGYYDDLTILEKYEKMSEAERADLLSGSPSKRRAVLIFQNWTDWAKSLEAGQCISTNHTRGQHGKTAISVDLQTATGEDLAANEVYRAMKAVAKLSVQEPDEVEAITDEYGREHITGGAFEYHEKVNPDATGQSRKYKLLKLTEPDAITMP